MKGIVFSEFLEWAEDRHTLAVVDEVIESARLDSGGAYTAVGTYDHFELIELISRLSTACGEQPDELVRQFGRHLFERFAIGYPDFFQGITSTFAFLKNIEGYIHVEVLKLYPDAELPHFEYELSDSQQLTMTYRSSRPFGNLAQGLIEGCIAYFGEPIDLVREDLSGGQGTQVRFVLTQKADDERTRDIAAPVGARA